MPAFTTQELIECAQQEKMRRLNARTWDGYTLLPLTNEQQKEIHMMEGIVGLLGNMESMQQTNQVLAGRLAAIGNTINHHQLQNPADLLQNIIEILNPTT